MKNLTLALALISTSAFAAVDNGGEGMYCAPSAEAAAQAIAKINGASEVAVRAAVTSSLNPTEGTDYSTKIDNVTYQVSTSAVDGDCSVNQVTKK